MRKINEPSDLLDMRTQKHLAVAQGDYNLAVQMNDREYEFTYRERGELLALKRKIVAEGDVGLLSEVDALVSANAKALEECSVYGQRYAWRQKDE
jgi:hypothetical protein